ncbi:Flagellum site-determining protein YlxH [Posidoniimonas corsicana]|uniref:Iron-sulfur cluster carrier protein n=1 Tax=Posidoniimonas corsicana TaxID=1938618 RepID=A0A5C5V7K3_9BACT|nr:Mrp/NBP35 family ATP-binding protein [Posidoniimonas corsicana]TWT34060.1 Flagellum site-determining protein YlxH [Posidoniimonas corsicana]
MSDLTPESVLQLLADFKDPETGRGVQKMDQVREVKVDGQAVKVTLGLTSWSAILADEVTQHCHDFLAERLPAGAKIEVQTAPHERPAEPIGQIGLRAKSVIAVGSGKGGVGKSTVATSLALALCKAGSKVGLMDADVYGPSVPHLLGTNERPVAVDKRLQPIEKDGLRLMSMGFLVPKEEAVVWRGPMLHGAITQFLKDTDWGDLDYLIIDMPPGTGDIALTLSQLLPLTGAVVVCTPQEVALLDAVKAIAMFRKVKIPLLGVVENMSYFLCPDNNKRYDIFGTGGARAKAEELSAPFLGELPINIAIRQRGDDGQTSGNLDDAQTAGYFEQIARQMVRNIAREHERAPAMPSLPVL